MKKMNKTIKNNIAYIIKEMYSTTGKDPGKKALQKMIYLIQADNVDMGYEYGIHFYGPYCAAIDTVTTYLGADDVISFDYSGYSHKMHVNDNYNVKSELPSTGEKKIKEVIQKFKDKTALELELLTTTHYVYKHIKDKSESHIIEGVKKIKGSKFSEIEIKASIKELGL